MECDSLRARRARSLADFNTPRDMRLSQRPLKISNKQLPRYIQPDERLHCELRPQVLALRHPSALTRDAKLRLGFELQNSSCKARIRGRRISSHVETLLSRCFTPTSRSGSFTHKRQDQQGGHELYHRISPIVRLGLGADRSRYVALRRKRCTGLL